MVRWKIDEEVFLYENRAKLSTYELAACLGRTYMAVSTHCSRIGIRVKRKELWTDDEISILRSWANENITWREIPINRSHGAIKQKATKLRIRLARRKKPKPIKKKNQPILPTFDSKDIYQAKQAATLSRCFSAKA